MGKIIKPKALSKGDTVAIVAPSEPVTKANLESAVRFLGNMGFKVKTGGNILKAIGDYVAGTPVDRAADFNWAFSDPEVCAVLFAVGGMGASQILDKIDFDNIKNNPKIFVGYSDATTLQLAILAKTGLLTFHGPNALSLPDFRTTGYTLSNFWKMLSLPQSEAGTTVVEPQSVWQEVRPGAAEGVLFGGNLSCVCKLLGTEWDPFVGLDRQFGPETKYLFFWEEDYEQFSEIMRNLWQIRNTGFFKKIAGMIVGKLTAVAEVDYQNFPTKKELIREISEPFGFPILYGVDFGHEVPRTTIPIGVQAKMDTATKKLEILEAAVV
ncbi:LD-carboxypeptidase [Patescibacteria group bacterium]|nr:LD-carboxypeptidase [Patescibacteria group bacterium]